MSTERLSPNHFYNLYMNDFTRLTASSGDNVYVDSAPTGRVTSVAPATNNATVVWGWDPAVANTSLTVHTLTASTGTPIHYLTGSRAQAEERARRVEAEAAERHRARQFDYQLAEMRAVGLLTLQDVENMRRQFAEEGRQRLFQPSTVPRQLTPDQVFIDGVRVDPSVAAEQAERERIPDDDDG